MLAQDLLLHALIYCKRISCRFVRFVFIFAAFFFLFDFQLFVVMSFTRLVCSKISGGHHLAFNFQETAATPLSTPFGHYGLTFVEKYTVSCTYRFFECKSFGGRYLIPHLPTQLPPVNANAVRMTQCCITAVECHPLDFAEMMPNFMNAYLDAMVNLDHAVLAMISQKRLVLMTRFIAKILASKAYDKKSPQETLRNSYLQHMMGGGGPGAFSENLDPNQVRYLSRE